MIKRLIAVAGLTGSTFSYFFLFRPSETINSISSLKVSAETKGLDLSTNNCYVLDQLDELRLLICSSSDNSTQPTFYLQETNTPNRFIWKIKRFYLTSDRDKSYFLNLDLSGDQTLISLIKNPAKYFLINNLEPLKNCSINTSQSSLYCERTDNLKKTFTIISLDKISSLEK